MVRKRRVSNTITKLMDDSEKWREEQGELEEFVVNYYKEVYDMQDDKPVEEIMEAFEELCFPCITVEQSLELSKEVGEDEIRSAVFEMKPFKVPGPDGLTAVFFQSFWDVVKTDIVKMVKYFFSRGYILRELNNTDIALIPKVDDPTVLKGFRPISLCNVCYKIISKVIANRLKRVIDNIISRFQSAFIKGRQINDNILLASELMTFIHKARRHKSNWCALKLDMAKAYDKVSWNFLTTVMKKMNFPDQFTQLIQQCVSTVSFGLLLNGQRIGSFSPLRGLRKGDPLSPFLFILCANVLSLMLLKAEEENDIEGIRYARTGPMISQLMYADDTVLFFKADQSSCEKVKKILQDYCVLAGQKVNFDKSLAVFSPNTPRLFKKIMARTLGVCLSNSLGKYLGVFDRQNGEKVERLEGFYVISGGKNDTCQSCYPSKPNL